MARKKRGRFLELFDIPGEGIAGQTKITLTGTRRIHIENHRGLLDYSTALIAVNCGDNIVSITGENLTLESMSSDELLIRGDVRNISFS